MVHFGGFLYFECQTAPGYHSLSLNRKEQHEHSAKKLCFCPFRSSTDVFTVVLWNKVCIEVENMTSFTVFF